MLKKKPNPCAFLDRCAEWTTFSPGLDRMKWVLKKLGNPEIGFKSILVGGTNGKGTVSYNLACMLGKQTGLFQSPHLMDVRERITLAGHWIADDYWHKAERKIMACCGPEPPLSYFEWMTVLATVIFADLGIETVVWEIGLGGRLDACNALEPCLSILTHVGMDHEAILGNTVEKIALEKVEIARCAKPFVMPATITKIDSVNSRLKEIGADIHSFSKGNDPYLDNLQALNEALKVLGLPPRQTLLPLLGRRQKIGQWWLDASHNPDGWESTRHWLKNEKGPTPIPILCNLSQGRDPYIFCKTLEPLAEKFLLLNSGFERELNEAAWPSQVKKINVAELDNLINKPLLVCGSIYHLGFVLHWLKNRTETDFPKR